MRVIAFTPFGGTKFMIPNAIDINVDATFKDNKVETIRSSGAYDNYGDQSPLDMIPFDIKFVYPCMNRYEYDNVFLAFSKRGWLDVQMVDGTLRSIIYKATKVNTQRSYESGRYLPFTVAGNAQPFWRSWRQRTLVGSGLSFNITTAGNAQVFTQMAITLSGHVSTVASFTLTNTTNGYAITWTGVTALQVGQTLTINPGACTVVRSTGADEYPNVTLGTTQVGLFKLESGVNALTCTALPGSSVWTFVLRDAWY